MFCPNCGTKNDEKAVFCANCGMRLKHATIEPIITPNTARPTTRLAQTATKPKLAKQNKIIISVVIVVLILVAGGGYYVYHQSQQSDKMTTSVDSTSGQASSGKTQSESTAKTTSAKAVNKVKSSRPALWSTAKTSDLASFMSSWQETMNQSYSGTYDGYNVDVDNISFPADIKNGNYKGKLTINGDEVALKWTTKANTDEEYQVVAASVYKHEEDGATKTITYLYVFHNGEPDVLVSQDSNSVYNFTSSENQTLQNGFAQIADSNTVD